MVMNITSSKGIESSNYNTTNTTQKTNTKNGENIYSEKNQGVSQGLETDTFIKSTDENATLQTYKPIKKKLTSEEVQALKDEQANSEADLIKKFINDIIKNQNRLLGKSNNNEDNGFSKNSKDLLVKIFGSLENAYPKIETTPEGAQAAIAEGGAYSVNAVADSIMTMATALAGDDQAKLQKMRDAVEEGFSQAGLAFKNATNSDLPQISKDTYTEIMSRFDKLQNKTDVESQINN